MEKKVLMLRASILVGLAFFHLIRVFLLKSSGDEFRKLFTGMHAFVADLFVSEGSPCGTDAVKFEYSCNRLSSLEIWLSNHLGTSLYNGDTGTNFTFGLLGIDARGMIEPRRLSA